MGLSGLRGFNRLPVPFPATRILSSYLLATLSANLNLSTVLNRFMNAGSMIIHEKARAQRALWTLDTMDELKTFKKGKKIVFFSHQWLAWSEPDPDCIQYKCMVAAFHELIKMKNLDLSKTFVWFDYTSIPQTHRGLQKLSINSLTNYAGACDYFIIVAPGEIIHKDTGG